MACVFCSIVSGELPGHEVFRSEKVVAFLDRAPVFLGHILVVPVSHVETLGDLPEAEVGPFMSVVRRLAVSAEDPLGLAADGTFVAVNNRVSQSVPHLHAHVVPRRRKDGLRGFFWPRVRYESEEQMIQFAALIRSSVGPTSPS